MGTHPKNRRLCVTADVGPFSVSVGFDDDGRAIEVFMTGRGKTGTALNDHLYDLGVTVSKIIQGDED